MSFYYYFSKFKNNLFENKNFYLNNNSPFIFQYLVVILFLYHSDIDYKSVYFQLVFLFDFLKQVTLQRGLNGFGNVLIQLLKYLNPLLNCCRLAVDWTGSNHFFIKKYFSLNFTWFFTPYEIISIWVCQKKVPQSSISGLPGYCSIEPLLPFCEKI